MTALVAPAKVAAGEIAEIVGVETVSV